MEVVDQEFLAQGGADAGRTVKGDSINVIEVTLHRSPPVIRQMPAGGYAPGEDDRLGDVSSQFREIADASGNTFAREQ